MNTKNLSLIFLTTIAIALIITKTNGILITTIVSAISAMGGYEIGKRTK